MQNSVKKVAKAKMCSACGACSSVCAHQAISYKSSSLGRVYPSVNTNCVNCGLCLKVCPSCTADCNFEEYFSLNKIHIAIGKARDTRIYHNGQSGGAVTAILTSLFKTRKIDAALVCNTETGLPQIITNESQLFQTQKSIYTPTLLLAAIDQIEPYQSVAIVGLPCHIAGLRNLMKYKQISIKYKLGLICDRSLGGTIKSSIMRAAGLHRTTQAIIKWRDKTAQGFGYHNAPITVTLSNGKQVGVFPSKVRQRLKSIFTMPRCLCCPDKLNISADIVFGDPWNIANSGGLGYSLIITNSTCGQEVMQAALMSGDLEISRYCSSSELNVSQHISERKDQVMLYATLLKQCNNLIPTQADVRKTISMERLRSIYGVIRFRALEKLPQTWVEILCVKLINKAKRGL